MSSVPVFVGLDYHQDSIQVCILDGQGKCLANRRVPNDAVVVADLATRYGRPVRIAVEACCGAANFAQELSATYGLPIDLGHPGYVARLKGSPDKTDLTDAQLLADLVRVDYLPKVWLAPDFIRELRRLTRHRQQLVCRRRDIKLRIRGLLRENRLKCPFANAWTKPWLAWLRDQALLSENDRWLANEHLDELEMLNKRITAVEARIDAFTAGDPVIAHLLGMQGVGRVTAVTLRAEVGDFQRFHTGKQLARFCSVSPRNASSGHRQADAGLIKAGNPQLRAVLIELAHRLMHSRNRWSKKGYALLNRGKPKNVAVAAVANRWVRWLHHEMHRLAAAGLTSAPARQKGPAPSAVTIAST